MNSINTQLEMHKDNAMFYRQQVENCLGHIDLLTRRLQEALDKISTLERPIKYGPDIDGDAAAVYECPEEKIYTETGI